jgi:hypothetical protein
MNDSGAYKGTSDAKPTTLSFIGEKDRARWNAIHVAAKFDRDTVFEAVINEVVAFVGDTLAIRLEELASAETARQDKRDLIRADCDTLFDLYLDAYLISPVAESLVRVCVPLMPGRMTATRWRRRCILQ